MALVSIITTIAAIIYNFGRLCTLKLSNKFVVVIVVLEQLGRHGDVVGLLLSLLWDGLVRSGGLFHRDAVVGQSRLDLQGRCFYVHFFVSFGAFGVVSSLK